MFFDLDNFKYINDSLGHAAGDKLLQSVSERLLANLRASDIVCRHGGDEFIILLSQITKSDEAATSAKKLLRSLAAPHFVGAKWVHIHASVGISVYPDDGDDAETLIQNADMAMYKAKESGRNTFKFFKKEMNARVVERQFLESNLRLAIANNEFVLHYQPKVHLTTGKVTGLEALIRWQHPDRGLISPAEFVPTAESSGLIGEIGKWVLCEACRQARAWQAAGLSPLPVAVNVSAIEFHHEGFLAAVRATLEATGLAARYLELELTERVLMDNVESTAAVLNGLKEMGVRLAIDDFGTGYSSLSYLRHFPMDILKIDRCFVQEIDAASGDSIIVNAIISMGKSLKYTVVAEGIETSEQRKYLEAIHCTEGQGYLFSRPLPPEQIGRLLAMNT